VVTVGLAVVDLVFTVQALPITPGKSFAQGYHSIVGGIAANAARAIAALGAPVRLVTRLGADAHGQMAADVLTADGVEITPDSHAAISGTAVSAVCIDAAGERMIVNHKQSALFDAPADAAAAVRGARAVMTDLRWPDGAGAVLRAAHGLPCLLDVDQAPEHKAVACSLLPRT
jgi:sulfofructose kinase